MGKPIIHYQRYCLIQCVVLGELKKRLILLFIIFWIIKFLSFLDRQLFPKSAQFALSKAFSLSSISVSSSVRL